MILPPKKDDSCVLWYDFTSIKNNTVYDQSRYGNHGTVYGAQHIGRFGLHGLHFDGVDDYIGEINATTPEQFTLIIFGEDKSTEDWALVFGNPTCNPDCSYRSLTVFSHFATQHYYQIGFGTTDGYWRSTNFWPGKNGQFKKFLIVTFDGTSLSINIDDRYKASSSLPYTPRAVPIQYIGGRPSGVFFQGDIYSVALYNRALSDAGIRELYYYLTKGIKSVVPSRFVARKVA